LTAKEMIWRKEQLWIGYGLARLTAQVQIQF
jgi:hypothetical protein